MAFHAAKPRSAHFQIFTRSAIWSLVAAAAISAFATPALSQVKPFRACLQSSGHQCRLLASAVGIEVRVANGDAMISYYVPAEQGWRVDRVESVNQDVDTQVRSNVMSDEDAAFAFAELLSNQGLAYKIPANVEQLKAAVGFAASAPLTPQDQVDVIAAHLQMTTGVSAVTADYLVMKLGLEIVEPQGELESEPQGELESEPQGELKGEPPSISSRN